MHSDRRESVRILYSGKVQGVGFRFNAKVVAQGYEVTGLVRNLPDGRVELIAEGLADELKAFLEGIRNSGLGTRIRSENEFWQPATGHYKSFEIIR